MSIIKIDQTHVTPEVVLDPVNHTFSIKGECYPENPIPFFSPILAKLEQHLRQNDPARFVANFHLHYVNSASTKGIQSLLKVLNDAGEKGISIDVYWIHDPDDDAMEELGIDLAEDFTFLAFNRVHTST